MLPSLAVLEKIAWKIKNIPNRKKESKRGVHFCCYLLCSKAGLRVNEAINFDLANKTKSGLYRIEKPKGKKERLVYIPKQVIRELRKNNWQPNQTNRHNFYHFLKKIKRELNISKSIELSPHTLRRAFTTYHAESGMPLPLLQKLLGHSSIRTTALYWHDADKDNDTPNILQVKNWLEKQDPPNSPPTTGNFASPKAFAFPEPLKIDPILKTPKASKPIFTANQPLIPTKKPIQQGNSLPLISTKPELAKINYQPKPITSQIQPKSEITPPLPLTAQTPTKKETILLARIKHLEKQLTHIQKENHNLTTQLTKIEQERDKLVAITEKEKQRANQAEQLLQKIIHQLDQEKNQVQRAQIIQPLLLKIK